MKRKWIIKLSLIVMFLSIAFFGGNQEVFASNSAAYVTTYEIESNVTTKSNGTITSTPTFGTPINIYEFWDENNVYNIIYEIYNDSTKLGWIKLDSSMNKLSEIYIPRYLTSFGNAIYHNGYLYVVYGANDNSTTDSSASDFATTVTIEMVKYNTSGTVVATLPIMGKDTSRMDVYNTSSTYIAYGTRYAFDAGNCDLAVNTNNVIKCVFAKEMYNGHQMSYAIYVDANTLEYLNKASTMDYNNNKYYSATNSYWVSHSFDQRVIATSDGQFLSVDRGDGNPRAFAVAKTYDGTTTDKLQLKSYEMFHFRESSDAPYAYNSTLSSLGNIVEVSDGYILVAASEKTLSLNYAQSRYMNESQNMFVQKYSKDFKGKTAQTMQMLDTEERKSESSRTDTQNEGSFYLNSTGVTDYGVKWLTNYQNDKSILETRAVAIDNDQVLILWAEKDVVESTYSSYVYMTTGNARYYYEIIDKNGNLVKGPYEIENAKLTRLIDYNYKDNCIYWTQLSSDTNKMQVNKLDLTKTTQKATLVLNKTEQTITDANITSLKLTATTNKTTGLTWTSTNTSVATVDNSGNVTIIGNGTATIKVSLNGYTLNKECKITVDYKCKSIQVSSNYYEMTTGASKYISVSVLPSNANNKKLEWKSTNESVVSINTTYSSGSVSILANGIGEADIIGTTTDGTNLSVTIKIKVIKPITGITIENWNVSVEKGKTHQFVPTITPTDATESVTWTSSDETVATVDQTGKVTAKANGTAYIYCTGNYSGRKDYGKVKVITPLKSLTLNKQTANLEVGDTLSLTATKGPSDTTDTATVYWKSSNSSIAYVSSSGIVTAREAGNVTITAYCGDVSTTCQIKITEPVIKITSITLNKSSIVLDKGKTMQLTATLTPTNTNEKVLWKSQNSSIATVNANGLVTAKNGGTTNIIAYSESGTVTSSCKVIVNDLPFIDVEPGDWFYNAVRETYKSNVILGTTDTTFEPDSNLTRGMLVTILWRMENTPVLKTVSKEFPDVSSNIWYYNAVNWAASEEIVSGFGDGEFKPNESITREQLAVILRNYSIYKEKHKKSTISLSNYTDSNKISSWAESAVQWAVENKIISGKENGTKIDPKGNATRAEAAAMICNYKQNIK